MMGKWDLQDDYDFRTGLTRSEIIDLSNSEKTPTI